MRYFGFLARYVVIPLVVLRLLLWRERQHRPTPPEPLTNWPEDIVLLGHVAVAVAYTTPWDNYLVAANVWSYNPKLVTGLRLGYVPIEEYSFFVLQSLLAGSWTQYLARRLPAAESQPNASTYPQARALATGALGVVWAASVYSLFRQRDNYLGLILGWALPPIMLQVGFGGDILWKHRRLIAAGILPTTTYLGITDSLAIGSGTWSINPEKTVRHEVIPHLPFEELLFFFLTNVLLVFGVTLVQDHESEKRLPSGLRDWYFEEKSRITGQS
jgi:lycopene beta-cyclase